MKISDWRVAEHLPVRTIRRAAMEQILRNRRSIAGAKPNEQAALRNHTAHLMRLVRHADRLIKRGVSMVPVKPGQRIPDAIYTLTRRYAPTRRRPMQRKGPQPSF